MIGGDIAADFESNSVSHCYESSSLRESSAGMCSCHAELAGAAVKLPDPTHGAQAAHVTALFVPGLPLVVHVYSSVGERERECVCVCERERC